MTFVAVFDENRTNSSLEEIQNSLEESRRREKLSAERMRRQQEEMDMLKEQFAGISVMVNETRRRAVGASKIHENIRRRLVQKSAA